MAESKLVTVAQLEAVDLEALRETMTEADAARAALVVAQRADTEAQTLLEAFRIKMQRKYALIAGDAMDPLTGAVRRAAEAAAPRSPIVPPVNGHGRVRGVPGRR